MGTPIFRWTGEYFGFVQDSSLFAANGKYLGWVDGGTVWGSDGVFRGEIVEQNYIVKKPMSLYPGPQLPKIPPLPPSPPIPSVHRIAQVPMSGWVDALDDF